MKNRFYDHKRNDAIKWTITLLIGLALIASVIGLAVKLDKQITNKTIGSSAYSIGILNEQGEYEKDTSSIYTANFIEVDGLTCTLAESAKVTYRLFFYDKDEKFISATESQAADYAGKIPDTAKFVKIVITPTNDAEVSIFEKGEYAKQLTVTVNK